MARTIVVFGPSGLSSPTIRLVTSADVVECTTTLTEDTFAKGRYTGDLDEVGQVASAGTYTGVVRSGSNAVGVFERVVVTDDDPSTVTVRDFVDVNQMTTLLALLQNASFTVTSPVMGENQSIELRQGMDYQNADSRAITITGATADQWPDLTGATVTLIAIQGGTTISKVGTVTAPTGTQTFYFEFTKANLTALLAPTGSYRYYVVAALAGGSTVELIEDGHLRIKAPFSSGEDD